MAVASAAPKQRQGTRLSGIEGLRALDNSGRPEDVERFALHLLWKDVRQPEVLARLAAAEERLRKPKEAATYYALFLRALDEPGADAPPEVLKRRGLVERRLRALKQDESALAAAYQKAHVKDKGFDSPESVDDVWMNNVRADLFSLHGLYAWKLIGGRKDAEAGWIHNTSGRMHRSCMKYVEEAEGRKGVLFTVPLKDVNSKDADGHHRKSLAQLGHNSHVEARNVLGRKFLRAGIRAYGFPVVVRVMVDGKEVVSETVGTDAWSDLKVELPATVEPPKEVPTSAAKPAGSARGSAAKPAKGKRAAEPLGQLVALELIVPEGQKWSEGVWLDYVDFFNN